MIKTPLSIVIGGAFWTPGCAVMGDQKTLTQIIKSLFANQEQGFTRDPYDLSAMFQDAVGTIPVTAAGQPVGLMLDKSGLALGANYLKTDTLDFTIGWSSSAAVTTKSKLSFTTSATGGCYKNGIIPVGKTTQIRLIGTCSAPWVFRNAADNNGVLNVPAGAFDITSNNAALFSASGSIYFSLDLAGTIAIDSISIQELKGNHVYQSTSAARPILRDAPRRIDFDTVDDKLITKLPAQLSGCTVIRSVPNVGTQILTGQTIPANYEDNTDHCGLIVINRALTASETSQITKLFNKAAGV